MASVISPLEKLDDNSQASVLFVLPWLRRDFDTDIDGTSEAKTFFKAVRKALPSFAAITLKPTPGMWKDDELDAGLAKYRKRIDAAVERYRPSCVVLLGVNFSKMLIPEIKNSKQDLRSTFAKLKMANGKRIMSMIYASPDMIVKDHLEFCRMPEVMAKLRVFAEKRRYDRKPIIHNLNTVKKAIEYIDFLAYEHKGMIGFDTETYSLNRVHHTRLGSMQFCHDDRESSVLLWDSKHQEISEKGRQKLVPHLEYLFGSRKTSFDAWIMHNAQFDLMQIFAEFRVKFPKTVFDTMLFAHLLDESRLQNARIWMDDKSGPYSLKVLVQEFLAFFHYSDEAMKARSSGVIMDLPLSDFLDYAGYDPSVTFRLFETFLLWAKLEKYDHTVLRIMRNLHSHAVKMYSNMSRTGINIDEAKLRELLDRNSVINKRLFEINEEYKSDLKIREVNKELAEQQAESSMFFRVPWIFDMNSSLHRNTLFFHSKNGFKFPANEDGKFSADKKFQKKYSETNKIVGLFAEAQGLVKLRNAYIKPIFENLFNNPSQETDVSDKRVHPEFLLSRTVTGRVACIAKGTKIEIVRDVTKAPKGVNIEDVRVGDLAYCYDRFGKPALRPVEAVMKTGHRNVIRLQWQGAGNRTKGHLDLTPEHRVRLVSGKYVRADSLVVGDRVMAMHRNKERLYFTGVDGSVPEHRFVWEKASGKTFPGTGNWHIHHKDGNHYNNVPGNLELLTNSAHTSLHGENVSKDLRKKRSANAKLRWKLNPQAMPSGKDSPSYWEAGKYELLRLLFKCGGKPSNCRTFGVDYTTFMLKLKEAGINWSSVAFRFGADGRYVSRTRLATYSGMPSEQIAHDLRMGTRKLKDLHTLYNLPYGTLSSKSYQRSLRQVKATASKYRAVVNNHRIIGVTKLRRKVDVYDLSIKGCHNFIANEITVHNCLRPNTQQVPRSDSYAKKEIKSLFIPSPGKVLLQADLSAAEVRVWGALSGDEVICRLSQEAFELLKKARANPQDKALREEAELKANFHKQTYGLCYNMDPKDVNGAQRQVAKKLTFGICYGMSDQGLARELGVEIEEAMAVKKLYFNVYKGGEQWLKDMQDFALENGYVETPLGRRRRMPQVFSGDKAAISEAKRFAVNAPIQATASDYAMLSTCLLDQEIDRLNIQDHARLINAVHDSVVLEVTADPEWINFVAKLVRRVFTVDVVDALKRDFDFELKAPIDIDIEVSQHYMHKCKKCGGKRYPGAGSTCKAEIKTGKKLENGKDEMKTCGHDKFEIVNINAGWGWLTGLEENSIGIANVCKGIKMVKNAPPPPVFENRPVTKKKKRDMVRV